VKVLLLKSPHKLPSRLHVFFETWKSHYLWAARSQALFTAPFFDQSCAAVVYLPKTSPFVQTRRYFEKPLQINFFILCHEKLHVPSTAMSSTLGRCLISAQTHLISAAVMYAKEQFSKVLFEFNYSRVFEPR
jgi:hypothetical protein